MVQINWVNTKICIFFLFVLIKSDKWVDATNPFNEHVIVRVEKS